MALDELLRQGVNKASEVDYGNPVYFIDTDQAPRNPAEFYRYVRRTIDSIMRDVRTEVVVNDEFEVQVTGEFAEKYFRTAQRLGIKSRNQADSYYNAYVELSKISLPKDERDVEYKRPSHFKHMSNACIGGFIGYFLSPKHYSFEGTMWGGLIGYNYDLIVDFSKLALEGIKLILRDTFRYFGFSNMKKRFPLAEKADDYEKFGRTIREGYVRL